MTQDKGPTTYRDGQPPVTEQSPKHAPTHEPEPIEIEAPTSKKKKKRSAPKKGRK